MDAPGRKIIFRYRDDSSSWMSGLYAAMRELPAAKSLEDVAAIMAGHVRETFGVPVAAVVIDDGESTWRVMAEPPLPGIPARVPASSGALARYLPGQIVEIEDFVAFADGAPNLAPVADAGIRYFLGAAFGEHEAARGYLAFGSIRTETFSENELALLALFALVTGIAVDRFRPRA